MSLESDINLLLRVRLFADLKPEHLRLLAFGAESQTLDAGTKVFRQGTQSVGGYVIGSGNIDLVSEGNGKSLSSHGPATLIGEMALITETKHFASAMATERTQVLEISRSVFRRMLVEYPQFAHKLHQEIGNSVGEFMKQLDRVRAKLDHATDLANRPAKKAEV